MLDGEGLILEVCHAFAGLAVQALSRHGLPPFS